MRELGIGLLVLAGCGSSVPSVGPPVVRRVSAEEGASHEAMAAPSPQDGAVRAAPALLRPCPVETLEGPQGVLFSVDGTALVVADTTSGPLGCNDFGLTVLHVYETATSRERLVLPVVAPIEGWGFTTDGALVVDHGTAASKARLVSTVDLRTGAISEATDGSAYALTKPAPAAHDPQSKRGAAVRAGRVVFQNLQTGETIARIGGADEPSLAVRVLNDASGVVAAARWPSGELGVWDLTNGRPAVLSPPVGDAVAFEVQDDGTVIVVRAPGQAVHYERGEPDTLVGRRVQLSPRRLASIVGGATVDAPGGDRSGGVDAGNSRVELDASCRGARCLLLVDGDSIDVAASAVPGSLVVFDRGAFEVLGPEAAPEAVQCRRGAVVEPFSECAALTAKDLLARHVGEAIALRERPKELSAP